MKDSAVAPAIALDPSRVRRMFDAMRRRAEAVESRREELRRRHAEEAGEHEDELTRRRDEQTAQCRLLRRRTLDQWDQAEETIIGNYEAQTVAAVTKRNQSVALLRRKIADEEKTIRRKVEARLQAVKQQYENRKNTPGRQNRTEISQIDEAVARLAEDVEWARALTIRRLNGLPPVEPLTQAEIDEGEVDPMPPRPASVKQSLDCIAELTKDCKRHILQMQSGAASKTVDSFYLPAGTAVFVALWMGTAAIVAENNKFLWIFAGIPVALVLAFGIYLILLMPLRRMTRTIYPRVERIWRAAEQCAAVGKKISNDYCQQAKQELVTRRADHLAAATRWREEQLEELQRVAATEQSNLIDHAAESATERNLSYRQAVTELGDQMRGQADKTAEQITQSLAQLDLDLQREKDSAAAERQQQIERLEHRLTLGQSVASRMLHRSDDAMASAAPPWDEVGVDPTTGNAFATKLHFLPLGWLRPSDTGDIGDAIVDRVPLVLHRRRHSTVIVTADDASMPRAVAWVQAILWRLLTSAKPGGAELTLLDPAGRGQNFTPFLNLADEHPAIISSRIWTSEDQIEQQLRRVALRVEDVLQSSLRDRFARIEDYNEVAGSLTVPYQAVAMAGLPAGLTSRSAAHLREINEAALRCGVMMMLIARRGETISGETMSGELTSGEQALPSGPNVLRFDIGDDGGWSMFGDGWDGVAFEPIDPPPAERCPVLAKQIATAAAKADRVEVPLESILEPTDCPDRDCHDQLVIPIGSQGAGRTLSLRLGRGVAQHVVIAGKTGSGKSSLLHSVITSGAHHYSPSELQFYLLDFKKGVEFKAYADASLPHARVIGIESEREFGRSVLQSLDAELQRRGEAFRAAAASDLAEYREKTDSPMPRLVLVVDEFQELFARDDRLASDCAALLDRLVRQGRSFGMHVILASQSLAGAYSLPRATLGQMAVRIAMQCGESDAALILADDNTAAKLLSRPGQAIYNDAGGLVEGNQPVQIAYVKPDELRRRLDQIHDRDQTVAKHLGPPIIFEGNRPVSWTAELADSVLEPSGSAENGSGGDSASMVALLGESVEIGPACSLGLRRDAGRNVLLVAPPEVRGAVLSSVMTGLIKHFNATVIHLDGTRENEGIEISKWLAVAGDRHRCVSPREAETCLIELAGGLDDRDASSPPTLVVINALERFRDLKAAEAFSFSLETAGSGASTGASALQRLLSEGPAVGVHTILGCGSADTAGRFLPRSSMHDLEIKIIGRLSAADSSLLIDSPIAAELSAATLLLYDDADGRTRKFRHCEIDSPEQLVRFIQSEN